MSSAETVMVDNDHPDQKIVHRAADIITSGGLLVYPTETLYGIGASATNDTAVARVHAVKRRSEKKPVLVISYSLETLLPFIGTPPPDALALMEAFWPGPLTLVFTALPRVSPQLTQGTGTIGARIPSNLFCLQLTQACGVPVTSTSANITGEPVPGTVDGIRTALPEGIDMYVDAGVLPPSKPSTVIDVSGKQARMVREGAISLSAVSRIVDVSIS